MTVIRFLCMAFAVLVAAGCNSDTYPVTGTVIFEDGTPVVDARVIFRTKLDGEHITAFATTDENGDYALTTWQTDDGAVLGEHKVIVTKPRQVAESESGQDLLPPEIHGDYASYETTPLKFTVKKEENEIDIELMRAE